MHAETSFARFSKYCLLFFSVAFAGWVWETAYFLVVDGSYTDRGFLSIPICPIYGFGILGVYFLLGTPDRGRGMLKNVRNPKVLLLLYFLLAALIPTVMEYATGWFFDHILHMSLWSYEGNFLNLSGYVCLSVTVFWGISITLAMKFLFPGILRLFGKIPDRPAEAASAVLLALTGWDLWRCVVRALP